MSLTATNLGESIELDFRMACVDLARAKEALRVEDSPAARALVSRRAAVVDAILDLGNDAGRASS
jgi:hypothetical protein